MKKFKLPFVFQLQENPFNPESLPDTLGIEIEFDKSLGLLKQKYDKQTDEYLHQAYELGSVIGGNTLEDEIGDNYTNGVLNYFDRIFQTKNYDGKKFLEIGCGIGYLLKNIQERGGEVLGIEPGKQGQTASKKYGINILKAFFPNVNINDKYDIVISYCVLEHVSDPQSFLLNIKPLLKPDGKVITIVPNEEPYIKNGDISTLFHEHWSYFTKNSLQNLIKGIGGKQIEIESSDYGGLLYSCFSFKEETSLPKKTDINDSYYDEFITKYNSYSTTLINLLNEDIEVGIYVPLRIVNYIVNSNLNTKNIRFFDDDEYSYQKFFPAINVQIENFEDFKKNPPKRVIVMSNFFGEVIKEKITSYNKSDIEIILWTDIFKEK